MSQELRSIFIMSKQRASENGFRDHGSLIRTLVLEIVSCLSCSVSSFD